MKRLAKGEGADPQIGSAGLTKKQKSKISIGGLAELIYNVPVWGNFPGRKLQKPNP